MNILVKLSASEMRAGLISSDFSAVELTKAHLDQIESTNENLNSFITVSSVQALKDAEKADAVLKEKQSSAPALCGIPVAIKDMLVTKGIETTCASKILKGFIPPYQCTAVAKLKKQGAVVVGKTNLDEFAMGSSNEHSAFGSVKNPWDNSRVAGGSSGGSAVAVAAAQAAISLGTDTGGSIRQPASFNGILGLKPTYGRVSRYGAVGFASSLDQIGPFARTVEDLALTLEAISGHDQSDATSMEVDVPKFSAELASADEKSLEGLKVGIPKEYFIDGIDAEVKSSVEKSLEQLGSLGAELIEISLPHTEYATATYYIVNSAEASSNLSRYDGVRYGYRAKEAKGTEEMYRQTRAAGFGREVKRRILMGTHVLSTGYYDAYYKKAQQVRTLIAKDFREAFKDKCDIIAAPVSPTTAFAFGEKSEDPLAMYLADVFTLPVNLAGLPGLSLPCGLDSNKLPIGLQLIAPAFEELRLLKTAKAFLGNTRTTNLKEDLWANMKQ
ncbi:aspartyl/glutamyl-tRNA amidotransferase subunit A [bacterium J17]|nr:aspartyl/glutamyl-tRNA amidotransferase subunit A [bacterium J17]